MSYYRLRDIVTPPFAYILNRDEVVRACDACEMPYPGLTGKLQVEICVNDTSGWETRIAGQPMMADHWLIGDAAFGDALSRALGIKVARVEVNLAQWLVTEPSFGRGDLAPKKAMAPPYFHYFPDTYLDWSSDQKNSLSNLACQDCRRRVPDLPIDWQPVPRAPQATPFAGLNHFHFDGYDYLFHESVIQTLAALFPTMLFEKLPTNVPDMTQDSLFLSSYNVSQW